MRRLGSVKRVLDRGFERSLIVLDFGRCGLVSGPPNGDDVEPAGGAEDLFPFEVPQCGPADTCLFVFVDSIGGMSRTPRRQRFDFHKNDQPAADVHRDQVDFARPVGFTLRDHPEALASQLDRGDLFAPLAELCVGIKIAVPPGIKSLAKSRWREPITDSPCHRQGSPSLESCLLLQRIQNHPCNDFGRVGGRVTGALDRVLALQRTAQIQR